MRRIAASAMRIALPPLKEPSLAVSSPQVQRVWGPGLGSGLGGSLGVGVKGSAVVVWGLGLGLHIVEITPRCLVALEFGRTATLLGYGASLAAEQGVLAVL